MQISTIGLDIAKNVFQVHGIDAAERWWSGNGSTPPGSSGCPPARALAMAARHTASVARFDVLRILTQHFSRGNTIASSNSLLACNPVTTNTQMRLRRCHHDQASLISPTT